MSNFFFTWAVPVLRTISQVLTATAAITSFSMMLYIIPYLKKEKLARIFFQIMLCVTCIYSADAFRSITKNTYYLVFWQNLHWTGFVILPAVYLHFSVVLLRMTGISKGNRTMIPVGLSYIISAFFLYQIWFRHFFSGITIIPEIGSIMTSTQMTSYFWGYFVSATILLIINFARSFSRTKTATSRRRITYLLISSFGILIGTFPLLAFTSGFASSHHIVFWFISMILNLITSVMILMLSYSVVTFSTKWSYRTARMRIIEWILRGPFTASTTLGGITLVNRSSGVLGFSIAGFSSIIAVVSILIQEYLILILMPIIERTSIAGYGKEDYSILSGLESLMITKSDLTTYLESLISVLNDKFQSEGGFIAVLTRSGKEDQFVYTGKIFTENIDLMAQKILQNYNDENPIILDASGIIYPIFHKDKDSTVLIAILGLTGAVAENLTEENQQALTIAVEKAEAIIWQRWFLSGAIDTLYQQTENESGKAIRSIDLLDQSKVLTSTEGPDIPEITGWVKDALTHYWGGPRLTENPLTNFKIVKDEIAKENNNSANGMRSVLKKAINQIKPEGERNYTGEWLLYNILDLKFIEGLKVKDVARKLSVSEADLYRKQKVAIEEIAKVIIEMENEAK